MKITTVIQALKDIGQDYLDQHPQTQKGFFKPTPDHSNQAAAERLKKLNGRNTNNDEYIVPFGQERALLQEIRTIYDLCTFLRHSSLVKAIHHCLCDHYPEFKDQARQVDDALRSNPEESYAWYMEDYQQVIDRTLEHWRTLPIEMQAISKSHDSQTNSASTQAIIAALNRTGENYLTKYPEEKQRQQWFFSHTHQPNAKQLIRLNVDHYPEPVDLLWRIKVILDQCREGQLSTQIAQITCEYFPTLKSKVEERIQEINDNRGEGEWAITHLSKEDFISEIDKTMAAGSTAKLTVCCV